MLHVRLHKHTDTAKDYSDSHMLDLHLLRLHKMLLLLYCGMVPAAVL